jgi:hypothetical protein
MAPKLRLIRAAWVLLFLCLLLGAGGPAVWAGGDSGTQLVLVLDLAKASRNDQALGILSQAAGLLVHLLKDQDYLGLVASCEPESVILPINRLTPEHRVQALGRLARLAGGPQPKPLSEVLPHALGVFQPGGPEPRVMFILSDGAREIDPQKKTSHLEGIRQVAAQARTAGVTINSLALSPRGISDELKTLTAVSGGRFWEGKTASDLTGAILNFYQRLAPSQEVPTQGTDFRLDQWVRQAVVVAARSVPGQGVMLVSPAGSRITPRTSAKTIQWVVGQAYDLITISRPQPGIWGLAGARAADSRVFVDTDLTLTTAGTPREVAADEALAVTAALVSDHETPAGGQALTGTELRADLQVSPHDPLTTTLTALESGVNPALPPGARVGRFSPLHQQGEATLRVLALGKTFQRLVSQPISITPPWYRPALSATEAPKNPAISFQPDPALRPERVGGTVTLQSAQGALSGVLITPAPGSEIILTRPPGCLDSCSADLRLTGTAPGGRPLLVASGPFPKISLKVPEKPAALTPEPAAAEKVQASPSRKAKRRWLWLALVGIGIAVLLAAALWFWQEGPESEAAEGEEEPGGKSILRLQAQLEALSKEKAQLQATLEEKNSHAANLLAEKADLQADLDRISAKTKGNVQSIEELEKKLDEAEREAQGVQQEYMALYARSQQEKEAIKKN